MQKTSIPKSYIDKTPTSERNFDTLLKIYKISGFKKQHKFHPKRRWRFDRALVEYKIAVEIDGGQWAQNGGRHNRDTDREKINEAIANGWVVLRFSTQQITYAPTICMDQLKRTIEVRRGKLR